MVFFSKLIFVRILALLVLPPLALASEIPSFEDVLSLRSVGGVQISPDGESVLYSVRSTDWKNNRYDNELWVAVEGRPGYQLTRTKSGSSSAGMWSPDSQWVAFLADRGDKRQIYLIRARGGEAQAATSVKSQISEFQWSADGKYIYFTAKEEPEDKEDREKRYGAFAIEDQEHQPTQLWRVAIHPDPWPAPHEQRCVEEDQEDEDAESDQDQDAEDECGSLTKPEQLTEGELSVANFDVSPDGSEVVIETRSNDDIMSYVSADLSILDVGSGEQRELVSGPGYDGSPQWSPDGRWIAFQSDSGNTTSDFYVNGHLKKVRAEGGEPVRLAAAHDEQISSPTWTERGIFFTAWNRTVRPLYRLNPDTDQLSQVQNLPEQVLSFDLTPDGSKLAFRGRNGDELAEVYASSARRPQPARLTNMTEQLAPWTLGTAEVIRWRSADGAEIEGVLHKPPEFDPDTKYPLLVAIHGGPTGISVPSPVATYVYPFAQWKAKGALILQPNYRGSAGYGEQFRSLNVRNLGVGDMWDVMSGVDYLIEQGFVDESRMGAMGWSQGGYISAFLATNTDRFKAISAGAGISNWMTYYVNTDIHPFTRQYLKATPWSDPDIYAKTSPMTNITQAKTPTLIQHGEFDRRVPTPNAYELYQGLQDMGVDTRLIIYKDFGHGITKPKERLAAVWHNWQWFAEYIWGEEVMLPRSAAADEDSDQEEDS